MGHIGIFIAHNWCIKGKKELLAVFGRLTADTQEFILEMAQNLLKRQEERANNPLKSHPVKADTINTGRDNLS